VNAHQTKHGVCSFSLFRAAIFLLAAARVPFAFAQEIIQEEESHKEPQTTIEAAASGGFPARFSGDFFIARSGDSAWAFHFSHQTINSLLHDAKKESNTGETRTQINGTRSFVFYNVAINAQALYQIASKDLQNQNGVVSDIAHRIILGGVDVCVQLPAGFALNAATGVSEISRNAGLSGGFVFGMENSAAIRKIPFDAQVLWQNSEGESVKLKAAVDGHYRAEQFDGEEFFLEQTAASGVSFAAAHGISRAGAGAGFFFDGKQFTVPWTLSASTEYALLDDSRTSGVWLLGGLYSFRADASQLESLNPFTWFYAVPQASSDWFFKARTLLALQDFSFGAEILFKQTAFGLGVPQTDYGARDSRSGLFLLEYVDRAALDTHLAAAFESGMIAASLAWNAKWMHADAASYIDEAASFLPPERSFESDAFIAHNETFSYEKTAAPYYPQINPQYPWRHTLSLSFSLVPQNAQWGARAVSHFFFSKEIPPFITLGVFYRFEKSNEALNKSSVRIAAQIQDALNFIAAKKRIFAEPFIADAGRFNVFLVFSY
jgi:hypothetical protein